MTSRVRIRWAALGAAVALGAGGLGVVGATIGSGSNSVFSAINPCRLVDTRPAPATVGSRATPLGPGEIATFAVQGTNGDCTIPTGATSITSNVTIVGPTSDGFLALFPADAPLPNASNLNWSAGQAPTPNAVTVDLSADGRVGVFNERGTVDVIIDIVGFFADHDHDDRYYTKIQTDSALAGKADSDDVYTKAETEAIVADSNETVVVSNDFDPPPSAFQLSLPGTGTGTGIPVTTTETAVLEIDLTVWGGLRCASSSRYVAWIELDGEAVPSSATNYAVIPESADTFSNDSFITKTLVGVTPEPVPAGPHTVVARLACSTGDDSTTAIGAGHRLIIRQLSTAPIGTLGSLSVKVADEPPGDQCVVDGHGVETCVPG